VDTADSPPRPSTEGSGGRPESDPTTGSDAGASRPATAAPASGKGPKAAGPKPAPKPAGKPAARPAGKPATPPPATKTAPPAAPAPGVAPAPEAAPASSNGTSTVRGSGAAPVAVAASVPVVRAGQTAPQPVATAPIAEAPPRTAPMAATRPVGPRRARLLVTRLDPWSVMKTAFMLSVSVAVVLLVATALLWWTLSVTGVFEAVGRTVDDIAGSASSAFDFLSLVSFSRVMGVALVLSAIEIVLVSALTTLFAFLYNLSVGLTGGLEVTLSEDA